MINIHLAKKKKLLALFQSDASVRVYSFPVRNSPPPPKKRGTLPAVATPCGKKAAHISIEDE